MANGQYANGNNEQYGAVPEGGGSELPAGAILMWAGTIASVPAGYAFCNGQNGTPDLRDRFVVCAQADSGGAAKANPDGSGLAQTGGSSQHDHLFRTDGHMHDIWDVGQCASGGDYAVPDIYTDSIDDTGTTNTANVAPPFFALAYIMKL